MITHDVIKIKLSREGYLPNYPPHLISDEEMCDAFLPYNYDPEDPTSGYEDSMNAEFNYFRDMYPLVHPDLLEEHRTLTSEIAYHLNQLKKSTDDIYILPDWVYSYMLGTTLTVSSDQRDLHDLFVMLGTDNLFDEFDFDCCRACYAESQYWIKKLPTVDQIHRPPTIFGEPHVIKSLRLKLADFSDGTMSEYRNPSNEG